KSKGCELGYKCMADGECIHFSVPVQEYCNTAYREHGLFYNPSDPGACEKVGKVCSKIDDRCDALSNKTPIEGKIKDKCITLKHMCLQCQGDCKLRKNVGNIEGIIYGIAAGIAILMLTINGIRLLTSDDSTTRDNAKKSIIYVILSLLIIVIAVKFIEYVWISLT
ncbi:MAG: pilin, partial [Candidatus Altiarchaeota archaeon]|nr:pilin [Candidatus Altiarchaeota archaeon]